MGSEAVVLGVGMVPFAKPGRSETYDVMAARAARSALQDAGIGFDSIEQVYAGYVFGDSTCGQRAVYGLGLTGVPVFNVNNNCSTGSAALMLARQAVAGGAGCVLAIGFEQMERGALSAKWDDRPSPLERHLEVMGDVQGFSQMPMAAQMFGGAGHEYQQRHGTRDETFAKISEKARKHGSLNPHALFRERLTVEEILASPTVHAPLTRFQCCPPTCGAAAAVVCSVDFAAGLPDSRPVRILAQSMTTDSASSLVSVNFLFILALA